MVPPISFYASTALDSMRECWYCYTEVESHDWADPNVHETCNRERDSRVNAQLCVFCGESLGQEEIDLNDIKHEKCRLDGTYHGYK